MWGHGPFGLRGEGRRGSSFFTLTFFYSVFPFSSAPFGALGVSIISPFGPLDCLCLLILTCK